MIRLKMTWKYSHHVCYDYTTTKHVEVEKILLNVFEKVSNAYDRCIYLIQKYK